MTATAPAPTRPAVTPSHFGLAVLALATGGFAIGTTEFVTMGVLPQIADGVEVSIPSAGHLISSYALGVVIGAPVLAYFGARLPRRGLLIGLMAAYALFNALSAVSTSFEMLFVFRFLDGLPHGIYFGVASLVAASMASPERKGRAVASVMLGLSVANVVGVPAATWLGQQVGWRAVFLLVAVMAVVTAVMTVLFVPSVPGDPDAKGRRELAAFTKSQVWLTLAIGAIGFGGMFALMSYIAKTVTETGGLHESAVPVFLLAFGLGMVFGTWVAGELARWSILKSLVVGSLGMAAALLGYAALAPFGWAALPMAFLVTSLGSVLVVNLQLRLMDVAGEAQTLGAAMNHASLNVANALGAWLGGLVIAAGYGYRAPALVGVGLSLAGFVVLLISGWLALRRAAQSVSQSVEPVC